MNIDAGADELDAYVELDAPPVDSGETLVLDASNLHVDGAADGGEMVDSAMLLDAHSREDSGPCFDTRGEFDDCTCDPPRREDCSAAPCRGGFICLPDGCGMHCSALGRACSEVDDCPPGSICSGSDGVRTCHRDAGCADSRDCAAGFACEAGECRDRRIRCGVEAPCPYGFVCDHSEGGVPYCVRAPTRCASDAACLVGMQCRDVDGDGLSECIAGGTCSSNADCPSRSTCETLPLEMFSVCGSHGICRHDSDCALGARCVDLWGDGIRLCADMGGLCTTTSDCASPQLCASPADGGPPRCMGDAL